MSKAQPKVAREVAVAEFERMCIAHRLDLDVERDEAEQKQWDASSGEIIGYMMSGRAVVDESGLPTYTTPDGAAFKFRKATGATYVALETYGPGKQMQNMIAAIADLTHTDRPSISKLEAPDFHALCAFANLFLVNR